MSGQGAPEAAPVDASGLRLGDFIAGQLLFITGIAALTYALIDNYSREWTPTVGDVLGPERFNTILGVVFLVIVLASPGGLVGLWEQLRDRLARSRSDAGAGGGGPPVPAAAVRTRRA